MKIDIYNTDKKMLAVGKAGEHLVCSCLLQQGYDCFMSTYELPYDILAVNSNEQYKIQVKTAQKPTSTKKSKDIYRYWLRCGKTKQKRYGKYDYFAFVALDIMEVAFVPISELINKNGQVKSMIEFRSTTSKFYTPKCRGIENYKFINQEEFL